MKKVFLSHSSLDKPLVKQIRKALLPFNNYLWIDELEILPGDSLIGKLSDGISESERVLVFISENSINSKWVKEEIFSFIQREMSEDEPRIIPILIDSIQAPPFLNHKFQVRFNTKYFAKGIAEILKGIFRKHSVFIVSPNIEKPVELNSFVDEIEEFKDNGREGNIILVYNYYDFVSNVINSLKLDNYRKSDRLKIALPKSIDFISSITPELIKTVLNYFKNDACAAPTAEETVKLVWRFTSLVLFNYMFGKVDESRLIEPNLMIYKNGYNEVSRLESIKSKYIPDNYNLGILVLAWLEYLNISMDSTFDIGFRGTINKEGIQIADAVHVRIPKGYVREDSLTIFRDTAPDSEFLPIVWVRYILPYIVSDAISHCSFSGYKPSEVIQKIGLKKSDYSYFGIE